MDWQGVRIGCLLPHAALAAEPGRTAEYFRSVEDLGFHYVAGYDHVAGAPRDRLAGLAFAPYTVLDPFLELLVTLAHGAAVTTTLGLDTGVLVMPQRQTVLAAKQLATLADLSGGRVRVGLGVGWNPAEFAALGVDYGQRGARLDQQVPLLRGLWEQETVTASGAEHQWGPIGISPRPHYRIPLWFGGSAEATLRRVVTWGDGFIPSRRDARTGERPDVPRLVSRLRQLCDEVGRHRDEIGIEGRVDWAGDHEAFRAAVESWMEVGATHVAVTMRPETAPSIDAHVELLASCLYDIRSVLGDPADAVRGAPALRSST